MEFFNNLNTLFIDNKEVESLYINGKQVWPLTDPTPQLIVQFFANNNGQTVTVNFKGSQVGETLQYIADDGTFTVNRPYSSNTLLRTKTNLIGINDLCNSISSVGKYSCYACTNLSSVVIDSAVSIGLSSFAKTTSLAHISMSGILSIDEDAFSCDVLESSPNFKELSLFNIQYINAPVRNRYELTSMNVAEDNDRFYFLNGNNDTTKTKKGAILIDDINKKVVWCSQQNITSASFDNDITTIGKNAFYMNKNINTVNSTNLSSIEDSAFYACNNLTSIGNTENIEKLGKSCFQATQITKFKSDKVTEIPDYAFAYTYNALTSLDVPNVSSVGEYGLTNARALTSINFIPQKLDVGSFAGCIELTGVTISAIKDIPANCFSSCEKLTVSLSDAVTIGFEAFKNTPIAVADMNNVSSLGGWTFSECDNLVSVYAPNIKNIKSHEFRWCPKLTALNFPELTSIGDYAFENFYEHDHLYSINCPKLKNVGREAFYHSKISSLYVPDCLSIGGEAFSRCNSLVSVYCPNTTTISSTPFSDCSSLVSVVIGEDNPSYCNINSMLLTKDKKNLIWNSTGTTGDILLLTDIISVLPYAMQHGKMTTVFGQNVKTLGDYSLAQCKSLISVSFPKVSNIATGVFNGCTNLKNVDLSNVKSLESFGYYLFKDCSSLISVDFPLLTSLGGSMFQNCNALQSVNAPNAIRFSSDVFNGCEHLTCANISNIIECDQYSFKNCKSLTSLNIPKVTSLNYCYGTFENCIKLKEISCQSISSFRSDAFISCSSLTSIYIGEDNDTYYSYDNQLILNSDRDTILYCVPGVSYVNNVHDTITTISSNAFYNSYIISADLSNIRKVENRAFYNCKNLTDLRFDKLEEFGATYIDFYDCNSLSNIYILTDAVPTLKSANIFDRLPVNYTIYVKPEMLESFSTAEYWSSIYANGHISAYNN